MSICKEDSLMQTGLAVLALTLILPALTWAFAIPLEQTCWRLQPINEVLTWTPKMVEGKAGFWGEAYWVRQDGSEFTAASQFFHEPKETHLMIEAKNVIQPYRGLKSYQLRLFWLDGVKRPGTWRVWGPSDPPFRLNGVVEPIECPTM